MTEGIAPPGEDMKPELGVLFVHGIGEQPQANTLLRFATPMIKWLRDWLEQPSAHGVNTPRGQLRIEQSILAPPLLQDAQPAHVLISMDCPASGPSKWLLAESWWASEFRRPPFSQIAGWLLTVGTWVILSHAGKRVRLAASGWGKTRAATGFLSSILLAALLQVLVALLALLAVLPIPPLRKWLSGVLLTLTGTLGDSYVLLSSPIERAAAVHHVRCDLQWLARQCRQVVVVAHSQGAAIAHEALQTTEPANVPLLLTLGSGLGKLEELRILQYQQAIPAVQMVAGQQPAGGWRPVRMLWATPWALPLFIVAVLVMIQQIPVAVAQGYLEPLAEWTAGLSLAVFFWVIKGTLAGWGPYLDRLARLSLRSVRPDLLWLDCYSRSDPVPNGPLSEESKPVESLPQELLAAWCLSSRMSDSVQIPGMYSVEVVNQRSVLSDHSAYWDNRDQFVSLVALQVAVHARTGLLVPNDLPRLARVPGERGFRVMALVLARLAALMGTLLALYGVRHQLVSWGQAALDSFAKSPPLDSLSTLIGDVANSIVELASLFALPVAAAPDVAAHALLGIVLLVIPFWGWHGLVTSNLWRWWDRYHVRHVLNPLQPEPVFPPLLVYLAGLTPLVAGIALMLWPNPLLALQRLGAIASTAFGLLVLLMFVVDYVNKLRDRWKRRSATGAGS